MSVREAQQRIDRAEFCEWQAINRMSPIGGERLDLLAAQLVAAWCAKEDDDRTLEDFAVKWGEPMAEPEPIDQNFLAMKIKSAFLRLTPPGEEKEQLAAEFAKQAEAMEATKGKH